MARAQRAETQAIPTQAARTRKARGLASMTGFARSEGESAGQAWVWEARSVNGKGLDVRLRLPPGLERLEAVARAAVAARFKRGNVGLTLNRTRSAAAPALTVNRPMLDAYVALARELEMAGFGVPRADGLLALRGVLETAEETEEDRAAFEAAAEANLAIVLDRLAAARDEEGARLAEVIVATLGRIEALVAAAEAAAASQPAAIQERLRSQLADLVEARQAVSEERLAQEIALLAQKADVREEIDRLTAHIAQARDLVSAGEAVGRRLDFLCQEFNREANTLCSKSSDVVLTRIGLDLKATIDQLREQVQNIE